MRHNTNLSCFLDATVVCLRLLPSASSPVLPTQIVRKARHMRKRYVTYVNLMTSAKLEDECKHGKASEVCKGVDPFFSNPEKVDGCNTSNSNFFHNTEAHCLIPN